MTLYNENLATATYDYRLGALGGAAWSNVRIKTFMLSPGAPRRSARGP